MASKTAHPLLAEAVVASGTCSSARRFCVSANCSKSCDRFCRTSSGRSCGWHIGANPQKRGCCTVMQKRTIFKWEQVLKCKVRFWSKGSNSTFWGRGKSAGQETRNFVAGHKSRFITLPCSRISILAFQQSFQASFRVEVWWFSVKRGQLGSCLDNDKDSIKMVIQRCQQQSYSHSQSTCSLPPTSWNPSAPGEALPLVHPHLRCKDIRLRQVRFNLTTAWLQLSLRDGTGLMMFDAFIFISVYPPQTVTTRFITFWVILGRDPSVTYWTWGSPTCRLTICLLPIFYKIMCFDPMTLGKNSSSPLCHLGNLVQWLHVSTPSTMAHWI